MWSNFFTTLIRKNSEFSDYLKIVLSPGTTGSERFLVSPISALKNDPFPKKSLLEIVFDV